MAISLWMMASSIPALSSFSNYLGSKTKVLKNHLPGRVRISLAQGLFSLLSRFEESLFLALHIQTISTCTYTQHTRMRVWPCKELWTATFACFVLRPKTGSEFLRCDSMLFQFEPFSNSLQTSCVTALRLTQFIFFQEPYGSSFLVYLKALDERLKFKPVI